MDKTGASIRQNTADARKAEAYDAQVKAFGGPNATALVNAIDAIATSGTPFMPSILVMGGRNSGTVDGLAASLLGYLSRSGNGSAVVKS